MTIGKGLGAPASRDEFVGWLDAVIEEMATYFVMQFMHEHLELEEFYREYQERRLDMHEIDLRRALKATAVQFFRRAYQDTYYRLLLPQAID